MNNGKNSLLKKIEDHTARVGVIGLGYVGLPLSSGIMNNGYSVVGFDTDEEKIEKLQSGHSYIDPVSSDHIQNMLNQERFHPTGNFDELENVDVILICVPTPLKNDNEPDLSHVKSTARQISQRLRKNQLVVLESTTYPGTTRDEMVPILETSGLTAGTDFYVAYSPEREDPGNKDYTMDKIPKVVGGYDEDSSMLARAFYQRVTIGVVAVKNLEVAEATKLLENIYRAVNIALVNELKLIFSKMDIDIWEVIQAASTKPFGYHPFYPGPGLGGHCIPIDPYFLSWKAKENGMDAQLIQLAGEINTSMPRTIVQTINNELNSRGKAIDTSKGLILGVAYKKDVDDTRGSPAFKLIDLLRKKGTDVDYHDPRVPELSGLRNYDIEMKSVEEYPEVLKEYDFVLITTDHSSYNPEEILEHANLVFDSRNLMADTGLGEENVIKV